jgi:hypothetical protein
MKSRTATVNRIPNGEYFILEKDDIPIVGIMGADALEDYLELQDPKIRDHVRESHAEFIAGKKPPGWRLPVRTRGVRQRAWQPATQSMTQPSFAVRSTPRYERLSKELDKTFMGNSLPQSGLPSRWRSTPLPRVPQRGHVLITIAAGRRRNNTTTANYLTAFLPHR